MRVKVETPTRKVESRPIKKIEKVDPENIEFDSEDFMEWN